MKQLDKRYTALPCPTGTRDPIRKSRCPFSEADAEWMPTYWDVIALREGLAGNTDADYWKQFGFDQLEVPEDCTHVSARMSIIENYFDELYANRQLNSETMQQWQMRLQRTLDTVVYNYERAYTLYETYNAEIDADLLPGKDTERNRSLSGTDSKTKNGTTGNTRTSESSGSDDLTIDRATTGTESGTGKETRNLDSLRTDNLDTLETRDLATSGSSSGTGSEWDAPDSASNRNEQYADKRTSQSGSESGTDSGTVDTKATGTQDVKDTGTIDSTASSESAGTDKGTEKRALSSNGKVIDSGSSSGTESGSNSETEKETVRTVDRGMNILASINGSADGWRHLDMRLAREFENNFLNVFWS